MLVLVMLSSMAFATPPFEVPPGLDKGGNSNADAKSTSISNAGAQSAAAAGAISGSVSNATGGDARATGGTAVSNSKADGGTGIGIGVGGDGGNAKAYSEGSTSGAQADSTITTTVVTNSARNAGSSAASVYGVQCQEGGSGQTFSGGASTITESAMCQSLKMGEVHERYWKMYAEMGDVNQAEMHKQLMMKYIAEAGDAADVTYYPKIIGSTFLSILPVGLIAFLL